jgi:hypothetical protein
MLDGRIKRPGGICVPTGLLLRWQPPQMASWSSTTRPPAANMTWRSVLWLPSLPSVLQPFDAAD